MLQNNLAKGFILEFHSVSFLASRTKIYINARSLTFRIGILIRVKAKRFASQLFHNKGEPLQKISRLSETDLQNFFQTEVFVFLNIVEEFERKERPNYVRTPESELA